MSEGMLTALILIGLVTVGFVLTVWGESLWDFFVSLVVIMYVICFFYLSPQGRRFWRSLGQRLSEKSFHDVTSLRRAD